MEKKVKIRTNNKLKKWKLSEIKKKVKISAKKNYWKKNKILSKIFNELFPLSLYTCVKKSEICVEKLFLRKKGLNSIKYFFYTNLTFCPNNSI